MKLETRDHKDKLQQAAKAAGLDGVVSLSSSENDSDAEGGDFTDDIVQVRVGENNAKEGALTLHNPGALSLASGEADNVKKALEYAQKTTSVLVSDEDSSAVRFTCEYPVNDLPAMIRSKLQSGAFLRSIADECKTSIIKKGIYFDPKKKHSHRLKDGERPLYLLIVGQSAEAVQEARSRLNETRDSMLEKVRKKASAIGAEL
ncbi:ATP-dependent DEAD/H RNA helicase [Angomonas deanei]|uniref:ATP-dependent RNA helicase PRP5/DDX46/KHDC4 KH domain-containing protein n=1 Tax=Angomonas deanei TaxID=59799 RepID=A0A7G2CE96_9TRYP|nr:ATP-dependent DEAD/H RNA helicase [Angomonas deanei]CAD2217013.1 hypothetical protein, conserved [Angomonas deanei]|eukprot:EPY40714.1 ATP-dependent DEAD/H RNA helicase [Angomonas deanei]